MYDIKKVSLEISGGDFGCETERESNKSIKHRGPEMSACPLRLHIVTVRSPAPLYHLKKEIHYGIQPHTACSIGRLVCLGFVEGLRVCLAAVGGGRRCRSVGSVVMGQQRIAIGSIIST